MDKIKWYGDDDPDLDKDEPKSAIIEWYDSDEEHLDEIALLRLAGHKVNLRNRLTSEEITRLQTESVDLIITELYLEGDASVEEEGNKLGLYLLEQVSEEGSANQDTPMLAYTLIVNKSDVDRTKKIVGQDNYLAKPMSPERLVEKIESLL